MASHRFSSNGTGWSLPVPPLRAGDVALLALGAIIVVAAFSTLSNEVERVHRQTLDRKLFTARVTASGQRGHFEQPRAFPGVRADRVCALRRSGAGTGAPYRLCFVLRTEGPTSRRVVGGYRLPTHGKDSRAHRYACFGAERVRNRCGHG